MMTPSRFHDVLKAVKSRSPLREPTLEEYTPPAPLVQKKEAPKMLEHVEIKKLGDASQADLRTLTRTLTTMPGTALRDLANCTALVAKALDDAELDDGDGGDRTTTFAQGLLERRLEEIAGTLGDLFCAAWDAVLSALQSGDADPAGRIEAELAAFSAAVNSAVTRALGDMGVGKAGKKISAARLKVLREAIAALQSLVDDAEGRDGGGRGDRDGGVAKRLGPSRRALAVALAEAVAGDLFAKRVTTTRDGAKAKAWETPGLREMYEQGVAAGESTTEFAPRQTPKANHSAGQAGVLAKVDELAKAKMAEVRKAGTRPMTIEAARSAVYEEHQELYDEYCR